MIIIRIWARSQRERCRAKLGCQAFYIPICYMCWHDFCRGNYRANPGVNEALQFSGMGVYLRLYLDNYPKDHIMSIINLGPAVIFYTRGDKVIAYFTLMDEQEKFITSALVDNDHQSLVDTLEAIWPNWYDADCSCIGVY